MAPGIRTVPRPIRESSDTMSTPKGGRGSHAPSWALKPGRWFHSPADRIVHVDVARIYRPPFGKRIDLASCGAGFFVAVAIVGALAGVDGGEDSLLGPGLWDQGPIAAPGKPPA